MSYIASDGTPITDEMVDRWAQEAEDGFAHSIVEPFEGRAWEQETQPLRLSDTTWKRVEQAAAHEHVSVSEWTRRAVNDALVRTPLGAQIAAEATRRMRDGGAW